MTRPTAFRWIVAIALLFVLAGLPVIPQLQRYHVDEQYYTDAALQMAATGDYLSPRLADGSWLFLKPIVTYWAVAGGFALCGPGFFGARLLFLLAGGAFLLLAPLLAYRLFRRWDAAVAAALILAANHDVWSAALRSTPDIWLALFVTLSFLGFAGPLFPAGPAPAPGARTPPLPRDDAWAAWTGAGLAVATKGLIGLVVPAWCVAFGAWRARAGGGVHRPPLVILPILVGAVLAGGWFVAVWLAHGSGVFAQFYADQVGTRTGAPLLRILQNAAWYLLVLPRDYLPWSLLLVPTLLVAPDFQRAFWTRHREPIRFVLGWYLVLFVMFSAANVTKTRYFLPAAPLVAALLGAFVVEALDESRIAAWLARARPLFPAVALLVGALTAGLGLVIDRRMIVAGVLWAVGGLVLDRVTRRTATPLGGPAAVAAWLLLLLVGYDLGVRPAFGASPAPTFARRLTALGAGRDDIVAFHVSDRHLAQLRVLTRGALWPRMAAGSRWDGDLAHWDGADPGSRYVIAFEPLRPSLAAWYDFEPCGWTYRHIHPAQILAIVQRGRPAVEPGLQLRYYLGTRRPAAP